MIIAIPVATRMKASPDFVKLKEGWAINKGS
jgi:hypothetical protein